MKKFPTDALRAGSPDPAPGQPAASSSPAPGKGVGQKLLFLALFVLGIAGIAFVAQYVPSWSGTPQGPPAPPGDPLSFHETVTRWDFDPGYGAEFENGTPGNHYCFRFQNQHDNPVELGLRKKSCTCSEVEVCLLSADQAQVLRETRHAREQLLAARVLPGPAGPEGLLHLISMAAGGSDGYGGLAARGLEWRRLAESKNLEPGLVVPPKSAGLVRVSWKGRKDQQLRLTATLWTQIQGNRKSLKDVNVGALAAFVPPVRAYPPAVAVQDWSTSGVGTTEFRCWSSTRVHFPLTAREVNDDPCVQTTVTPLQGSECLELERDLANAGQPPSHVLSGYRVTVTVHQASSSSQLERGHFQRLVSLTSAVSPSIPAVQVSGVIRDSDVEVGTARDQGVINLGSFRADVGKQQVIALRTGPGVKFIPRIEKKPDFMQVTLKEGESGGVNGSTEWLLRVRIPPNPPTGAWPADSAVILQTRQKDNQVRRVRIPVRANPYQ